MATKKKPAAPEGVNPKVRNAGEEDVEGHSFLIHPSTSQELARYKSADLERQARLIRKAGNRLKFDQKICEACGQRGFYGRVFKTHGHMHFAKCGCGAIGHIHE